MEYADSIIQEGGLIMQTSMTTNRMFVLVSNVVPERSTCLQTVTEDESQLWHQDMDT